MVDSNGKKKSQIIADFFQLNFLTQVAIISARKLFNYQ